MYHATGGTDNADLAIKVYKTSILVFKDRDRCGHFGSTHFRCILNLNEAVCTSTFVIERQQTSSLCLFHIRYVSGDYRFKTGYCRSNPRKMVKMWAEKELRNLARLKAAGLNVPAPIQLRMHVLVMEFIGGCLFSELIS